MEQIVIPSSNIQINLTYEIEEFRSQWDINNNIPIMLSLDYLIGLEHSKPDGMKLVYGYIQKKNKTIALFHLQIVGFDAEKRLRVQLETGQSSTLSDKIALAIKLFFARKVNIQGIILGNLLTAGPYGIVFDKELQLSEKSSLIEEFSSALISKSKSLEGISMVVIKDINPEESLSASTCKKHSRFHEFTIQPSMCLRIRTNWTSIDDYLGDLESKYRMKLKKVLRLGEQLKVIDADYALLEDNEDKIFALYHEVAEAVGFNLVDLKKEYFLSIKKSVPRNFKVKLVYLENELVAFYSYFDNGTIMNAHFVGYRKIFNRSLELYHNILLFYLKDAISIGSSSIEFARTALEIKSSLGAEPIDYYCYIAHKSHFINKLVPSILDLLKPVEEWQPRSPFKKASS
ncbi:MAG: hypothetical protein ABIO44_00600 [Saprospiraceae bacterium]